MNVFVYLADDASGNFNIDIRAQYTNNYGMVLESGSKSLNKVTDAEGKTIYSVNGLTATGMSSLNKVFVKAQSANVVDAYIDHMIVQQIRAGVVVNTFYLDCEHRNASMEFYALPSSVQSAQTDEQKVYLMLGDETEAANLVAENRDIAVALQYTTVSGGSQVFMSRYIYITDQQYQSIKSGDILELTFNESYVKEVTGVLIASSGNLKIHVDMACVDVYSVNAVDNARKLQNHFAIPIGAKVQNQTVTLPVDSDSSVEILDLQFVTALSDANLESGTNDPIIMVLGYTDRKGIPREHVVTNLRDYVVSEENAFSTESTTQVRLLIRDIVSIQSLQLMPYNVNPQITAGWKPSRIMVSLGADGSIQKVTRSLDKYIHEDTELNPEDVITGEMVGGLKVNLSNIILTADVAATNEAGHYGNSYRVNSAVNKTLAMTVSSGADMKFGVTVSNSRQGFTSKAEQVAGTKDLSSLISYTEEGFTLSMPENTSGQDQSYRITLCSNENENITVVIEVTVTSEAVPETPTEPTEPTEPSTNPTEPAA
jgi:hypothetical protein